MTAKTKFNFVR